MHRTSERLKESQHPECVTRLSEKFSFYPGETPPAASAAPKASPLQEPSSEETERADDLPAVDASSSTSEETGRGHCLSAVDNNLPSSVLVKLRAAGETLLLERKRARDKLVRIISQAHSKNSTLARTTVELERASSLLGKSSRLDDKQRQQGASTLRSALREAATFVSATQEALSQLQSVRSVSSLRSTYLYSLMELIGPPPSHHTRRGPHHLGPLSGPLRLKIHNI